MLGIGMQRGTRALFRQQCRTSARTAVSRQCPLSMRSATFHSALTTRRISVESSEESFKVAQVSCKSGDIEIIRLPPTEILRKTSILPRDLVSLDLTSNEDHRGGRRYKRYRPLTAIMPRTDSILLSFGNIIGVVQRETVYVLDAQTKMANSFAKDLGKTFKTTTLEQSTKELIEPPELVFIEAALKETLDTYFRRIQLFEPIVDGFCTRASNHEVFSEDSGVDQLVPLKDSLQSFEMQVKQSLHCLEELLNDDDEMLKLLVSEHAEARESGIPVDTERHQHVELLLGVYARQFSNIMYEIDYLLKRVESKQEFAALALAGYRNRLVRMNVNIAIVGVSTALTTAIAGFFGMNLVHGFEENPMAFFVITVSSTGLAALVAAMYFNFISGSTMQKRAAERMQQNETLTKALSDMSALDYAVKIMMQGNVTLNKDEFTKLLIKTRRSQTVTDEEINLLFELLDVDSSEQLSSDDFDHQALHK